MYWHIPVILVFGRLRQDDDRLVASLGYIVKTCRKKSQLKSLMTEYLMTAFQTWPPQPRERKQIQMSSMTESWRASSLFLKGHTKDRKKKKHECEKIFTNPTSGRNQCREHIEDCYNPITRKTVTNRHFPKYYISISNKHTDARWYLLFKKCTSNSHLLDIRKADSGCYFLWNNQNLHDPDCY